MSARWTTPTRRPNGGLRVIPPPTDRHVTGVVLVGVAIGFVTFGTLSALHKGGDGAVGWQVFVVLVGLVAVWLRLLSGVVFPVGVTLADGRFGLSRNLFGRLVWGVWVPAERVRRLVVRHSGESVAGTLAAGTDDSPLTLVANRGREDLRAVANELAAALGEVTVTDEDTHFTGRRAEQPVFSRLHTDGETVRLPAVSVEVARPVTELRRFGPEFRRLRTGYGLWALGVLLLVALGGLALGLVGWASVEVLVWGYTSERVHIDGVSLPHDTPIPDLPTRSLTVARPLLLTVTFHGGLFVLGLWLGRRLIRSVRRTTALVLVTRTIRTRSRPRSITLTLAAEALTVAWPGREPTSWAWADVTAARAYRVIHESSGEGGSSSTVVEWLEVWFRSGEVWTLRGLDGADWEWLATRVRTAAGLPEPAPVVVE